MNAPEEGSRGGRLAALAALGARTATATLTTIRVALAMFGRGWEKTKGVWRALVLRYMPSEQQHVFTLTLLIGVVCGLVAVGFHLAIKVASTFMINRAMAEPGPWWMLWTILTPTAGGVFAGVLLTYVVPAARGSGVPQVKEAFALQGGRLRLRDSIGKFFICTLQIGSGASLGREGPTVQLCAGTASTLARLTNLPARSARRLMPVGVAAGIAAAFNAPIAAVTFTIEEIVGTLDQTVLSGVVVAAAVAAIIERSVLGVHPVIEVATPFGLEHASSLIFYAFLGVMAAMVSVIFTDSLLKLRAAFKGFKLLPAWAHPGVGGLVTGVLAVVALYFLKTGGVTGGGYEILGEALSGKLAVQVLVALMAMKLAATVFSYSSGGAGGIFAPALFIGGMLGGMVGSIDQVVLGHSTSHLGAFALVGMGAVFAGIVRAPITSVLIIFEMTGSYGLVLPLMLANMTAYGLARAWRPMPIYEALLEQDGVHLPDRSRRAHPLEQLAVSSAMTQNPVTLSSMMTVGEAVEALKGRAFTAVPVRDDAGRYLGLAQTTALRKAAVEGGGARVVGEFVGESQMITAEEPLIRAVVRMNDAKVRQLAVLDAEKSGRLVGLLAMSDVLRAHARAALPEGPLTAEAAAQAAAAESATAAQTQAGQPTEGGVPVERRARAAGNDLLLQTRVRMLAIKAPPVRAAMHLNDLVAHLVSAKAGALPVLTSDTDVFGVVQLDQVREVWRDHELEHVLVAADVATRVPAISSEADLMQALEAMDKHSADALPVYDGPPGTAPNAVVTRAEIGRFLFGQYVRRGRDAPEPPGKVSTTTSPGTPAVKPVAPS